MADYQAGQVPSKINVWHSGMDSLINEDDLLKRKYPAVVAALDTPFHSLIPEPLYDSRQTERHLRLNFELPAGMNFHADHLSEMNAWNIWAVDTEVEETLKKHFTQVSFLHASTQLIKAFSLNLKKDFGQNLTCLHFIRNRFDLVILSESTLQFFNTFNFDNNEDVLYFTLYAAEQLKIRAADARLRLYGDIETESEIIGLLGEFLPHIGFGSRPEGPGYSPLFDFPAHKYPALFSLALCGS
jgi:hypothetical protein